MSMLRIALSASALLALATPAVAAPGVRVENAAARMVVIPENRSDVQVEVQRGDPRLPVPTVRREEDRLVVDGGLRGRVRNCGVFGVDVRVFGARRHDGPDPRVQRVAIAGVGPLTLDHLPLITAHVPMTASVAAGEAVFGRIGRSSALSLSDSGCGDWTLEDVAGGLDVASDGSGDIAAARAGSLHAALSGSGDLRVGDVARDASVASHGSADTRLGRVGGRMSAELSGSGDLSAQEVAGPLATRQSGSGDVEIAGGRSPSVAVESSGSGDFTFRGEAGAVSARSSGSGDIRVAHASGPVAKSHSGSGDIDIGR